MSRDVEQLKEPFRSKVKALITLAKQAGLPVIITDTTRTIEEQRENVRKGYSKTMDSKHLTGEAVDIAFQVNGKLSYDAKLYEKLYSISKKLSYVIWPNRDLNWNWDLPHFQYDKNKIIGDTIPMNCDTEKQEIQKLNFEIGTVTKQRDDAINAFKKEVEGHKQTLEHLNTARAEVTKLEAEGEENTRKLEEIRKIL